MANRIPAQGAEIKTEKIGYRSFQKNFGRSAKVRGACTFVATLSRKAEAAGGSVAEFSTRTARLSQFDRMSGEYVKKPLSQRRHVFADGTVIQRDLYSAFLTRSGSPGTGRQGRPLHDPYAPGHGTVVIPVLAHSAILFRPSG